MLVAGFGGHHHHRRVKFLLTLGMGALLGAVGAYLWLVATPAIGVIGSKADQRAGNVEVSFDEAALVALVRDQLGDVPGMSAAQVSVDVQQGGLVVITIGIGGGAVGLKSSIPVRPAVEDGRLRLRVAPGGVADAGLSAKVASMVEAPLQQRVDALSAGFPYELTSVRTDDERLTFEITTS